MFGRAILQQPLTHLPAILADHRNVAFQRQKRFFLGGDFVHQLGVACNGTQTGQSHMLPGPGVLAIILGKGRETYGDRASAPGRTQLHVCLIEQAFFGLRRQGRDQALRGPCEELCG